MHIKKAPSFHVFKKKNTILEIHLRNPIPKLKELFVLMLCLFEREKIV